MYGLFTDIVKFVAFFSQRIVKFVALFLFFIVIKRKIYDFLVEWKKTKNLYAFYGRTTINETLQG